MLLFNSQKAFIKRKWYAATKKVQKWYAESKRLGTPDLKHLNAHNEGIRLTSLKRVVNGPKMLSPILTRNQKHHFKFEKVLIKKEISFTHPQSLQLRKPYLSLKISISLQCPTRLRSDNI